MFSEVCDEYYQRGISIIPVKGKKVWAKDFGAYSHRLPSKGEIEFFKKKKDANVGLMLGRFNNLMAVDVDTDIPEVKSFLRDVLPDTPVAKFGKKGFTNFYRTTLNYNESFCSLQHGCMLEFHGSSRQTVIPPSIHPDTKKPYVWVGGSLLEFFDDIPPIPSQTLKIMKGYMRTMYDCMDMTSFLKIKRGQHANT